MNVGDGWRVEKHTKINESEEGGCKAEGQKANIMDEGTNNR